jgi:large subunit ribosomal protein L10
MHKSEKERVVAELTERLRVSETLLVADYRGLTHAQIDDLRTKLLAAGARFTVVKNTLTRRAAEAAGADALLAMLEGPTAIAFLESDGDPVAVAKALGDVARDTKVLELRGGIMQGATISAGQVEELAKLPPADVLRAQVLGAVTAPLQTIVGLFTAPLQDLAGLIDARIEQLEAEGGGVASAGAEAIGGETTVDDSEGPTPQPQAAETELESASSDEATAEDSETPIAQAEPAQDDEEEA